MRRAGSAYSQSRSDQRSVWLSKGDSGQKHPWTGGPQSDAPLTHPPGARCFVAQRPAEPHAEFLHLNDRDGFFPLWTCLPKWKSKRANCEHLGIPWAGVFPWLVIPWVKSHLICHEPACSCLFHMMLSSSGTRGQSLTVPPLNTPCDFTHLSQGLCIHFLDRILFILWLFMLFYPLGYSLVILLLPHTFSSFAVCFSRWVKLQMGRGAEQHWVFRIKIVAVVYLSFPFLPHIPPDHCF